MKAAKILVSGKVQGVFFRASTKEMALEYNIRGWCRNTEDGKVEIFAQGSYNNVNEFFKWCNVGSRNARVDQVDVQFVETEKFESFEIRY